MRVHLLHTPTDEDALKVLEHTLDRNIHVTYGAEIDGPREVLVTGRPSAEHLKRCGPSLKALVVPYAGIPAATRVLLQGRGLPLYNLHHNASMVAESAVALMLTAMKWVLPMDRALRIGDWRPRYDPDPALKVEGARVLVLGYGAIGRRIARLCRGLGMEVMATRRSLSRVTEEDGVKVYPADALERLLPQTQVLVVALPETALTRGLIKTPQLQALAGGVVVNIARAGIIDEDALFEALTDGTLHSAALDVWYIYPDAASRATTPPATRPFHTLDNVVMSPHRSGHGHGIEILRMQHLAAVLNALARGEDPPGCVDLEQGY